MFDSVVILCWYIFVTKARENKVEIDDKDRLIVWYPSDIIQGRVLINHQVQYIYFLQHYQITQLPDEGFIV